HLHLPSTPSERCHFSHPNSSTVLPLQPQRQKNLGSPSILRSRAAGRGAVRISSRSRERAAWEAIRRNGRKARLRAKKQARPPKGLPAWSWILSIPTRSRSSFG